MRTLAFTLPAILALLVAPAHLSAKGDTIRITIQGGDLATPINLTDPHQVAGFNVWSSPLIVDWRGGVQESPPEGLPTYAVSFVTTRPNRGAYRVSYVIDPATHQGYVYLPGKNDSRYEDNVWLIYHGVEGNWFRAWSVWERFAHPLIEKSRR